MPLSRGEEDNLPGADSWMIVAHSAIASAFALAPRAPPRNETRPGRQRRKCRRLWRPRTCPVWLPSANVFRGYLRVMRGDTEALAFARQGIAARTRGIRAQPAVLPFLTRCELRAGR